MPEIDNLEKLRQTVDKEINNAKKDLQNAKLDMSLGELASMFNEGDLIINPEFQRLFRWNEYQKTRLIESILVGIPIPSIFVVEDENGKWELIDGLQRLSTVFSFLGKLKDDNYDNWKLGKGEILKEFEGFTFNDLPPRARNLIKRYICRVEIIYYGSDYNIRYELFERLNTGGSPLSDQEIRNAIYRAESSKFNDFLTKNGSNEDFLNLINISENKIKRLYSDELVLRFCSLYKIENITKNLSNHMNTYMKITVKEVETNPDKLITLQKIFNQTINLLNNLDEENIFWRKRGGFSATLYDGIMIGLSQNITLYNQDNLEVLREKIQELKTCEKFDEYSGSRSHNAKNVKCRLKIADNIFKNVVK